MMMKYALVPLFVGSLGIACGGQEELSQDISAAGGSCNNDSDLRRIFRNATRRYENTNNLAPDGFVQLQEECFTEEFTEGGGGTIELGIVFINPGRVDGVIDPNNPEIIYYEPRRDGRLVIMGGEYFCPVEACPTPPTFCGHTFRFEEDTGGHALHVWAWKDNPNGLTFPVNPRVNTRHCP